MRTPKIEALHRAINWLNNYIENKKDSKLPSTVSILSNIHKLECNPLDISPIESNSWLTGFTDSDGNFSINIHKRSNKNSTRVQLYYRLEIKQNYQNSATIQPLLCSNNDCSDLNTTLRVCREPVLVEQMKQRLSREKLLNNRSSNIRIETVPHEFLSSFYPIMAKIGLYLGVTVYSRCRLINNKIFHSYTIMAHNSNSLSKIIDYFEKYPLLSSKYLDYKDWVYVLELQRANKITSTYLDKAEKIRLDFNSTRTTYTWDHLKFCFYNKKKE